MRPAGWLALGAGAGLGFLAACFTPPDLGGPFQCDQSGRCDLEGYSCVDGVCCKTDGGVPACSPIVPRDGGEDAGCILPPDPYCPVDGGRGPCANGQYSCASGTLTCVQTVFSTPEVCNDGLDQDCDGVPDNLPCKGGPANFLVPSAEWVSGAVVASKDLQSQHGSCLLNDLDLNYTRSPGFLDGGNWRASGAVTHFVYFQKDGGTWDLALNGLSLKLNLSGAAFRGWSPPSFFSSYFQPIVYLCGPGTPEGYRRYNPKGPGSLIGWSGNSFFVNASIDDLATGGANWTVASNGAPLNSVYRVEVVLAPAAPPDGGGIPSFDAGLSLIGFSGP